MNCTIGLYILASQVHSAEDRGDFIKLRHRQTTSVYYKRKCKSRVSFLCVVNSYSRNRSLLYKHFLRTLNHAVYRSTFWSSSFCYVSIRIGNIYQDAGKYPDRGKNTGTKRKGFDCERLFLRNRAETVS